MQSIQSFFSLFFSRGKSKGAAPRFRAIKLYTVAAEGHALALNRPLLVQTILDVMHHHFQALPKEYDISGPYGIRKGSSVGIKSFLNRLQKKGHDKYYAMHGSTTDHFGFELHLESGQGKYNELIIWFDLSLYPADETGIVRELIDAFHTDYGYTVDFPTNYSITLESEIRYKWGTYSSSMNPDLSIWLKNIQTVHEGNLRDLYKINFLNPSQYARLAPTIASLVQHLADNLYVLEFNDAESFQAVKNHMASTN